MSRPAVSRPDRGSAAVEIVVLTPVLVALMVFVVYAGRAGGAVQQTRHAADVAARAASKVDRPSMPSVARSAAANDLNTNGVNCADTSVDVAVGPSSVTVTVNCLLNTEGTALLDIGARTVSASSTEAIDSFRGGEP